MSITTINDGRLVRVNVGGLSSLMKTLKESDLEMHQAMQRGLAESARPLLAKARANAERIADDGTYTSSMSIAARRQSGGIALRTTDPAAGVKEFARPGAVYKPKSTDKRRNARKMNSFPVGVPKRANQPRALYPAIDSEYQALASRIAQKIDEVLKGA